MDGPSRWLARLQAAPLHLTLLAGFGVVLALSGAQSLVAYRTATQNLAADAAQYRSERVVALAGETRAAMLQMMASYQSYLLVGDRNLLEDYTSGAQTFTTDVAEIETLGPENHDTLARWQELRRRVAVWQTDIIQPGITQRQGAAPGALGLTDVATSQQDFQGIEHLLEAAIADEQANLVASHDATTAANNRFLVALQWGNVVRIGVGLAIALAFASGVRRSIARVHAGERRFRQMFEENEAAQLAIDVQTGAILDANPAACAFYGYSHAVMLGLNMRDVSSISAAQIGALETGGDGDRADFAQRHTLASGEIRDVEVHTSLSKTGNRRLVYAIVHDITERAKADSALAHQALHDGLTGLPNRTLLHARLQQVLPGVHAQGRSVALLLLDLDRFKEVNDTLGHQVGDVLLQQIGQRLQGAVRGADLVARLGGDEFAVLLPATDADGAAHIAEVLVRVLETAFVLEGQPIDVDASIGIAVAPEHGQDADALLRCADVAMYQAKRSGTGVALYNAADDEHRPDRLALLGELRSAIDNDELLLHYQPKVDLGDGSLVGVEALVRWQHPQRGFLPPMEFIPLAEQTGLIYPLSRWVLEAALKQQQAWRKVGIDVPVAVNLSRRTLHDPQLPEMVADLLVSVGARPESLVLEITESSLMADPVRAAENLSELRALGVRMSIDDFGTGYSSLASLKNLSVDELKIDQSFVQAMATDASSRAIVRAIIDLADNLKLRVVAEGVEDRATWDLLASLGCEVAQGYFLSRPIAANDLETWVRTLGPTWLAIAERSYGADDALLERIRGQGARLTAEDEFIAHKHAEAQRAA